MFISIKVIVEAPLSFYSCLWPCHHQRPGLQIVHRYMVRSASSGRNLGMVCSNYRSLMIPWARQHPQGLNGSSHHQRHEEWRSQDQAARSCMDASMLTSLFSSSVICTQPEKDADEWTWQIIFICMSRNQQLAPNAFNFCMNILFLFF